MPQPSSSSLLRLWRSFLVQHRRRLLAFVITAIAAACVRALRRRRLCIPAPGECGGLHTPTRAGCSSQASCIVPADNLKRNRTLKGTAHEQLSGTSHLNDHSDLNGNSLLNGHSRSNGDSPASRVLLVARAWFPRLHRLCCRRRRVRSQEEPRALQSDLSGESSDKESTGSRASTEVPSEASHPDFSGNWLCKTVGGDAERVATEIGAPWAMRRLAKSHNWGVGKMRCNVKQTGDEFVMEDVLLYNMGAKSFFCAGGGIQDAPDPKVRYNPEWINGGQKLRIGVEYADGREKYAKLVFFDDDELVIERVSPSGASAKFYYARQLASEESEENTAS